MNGKETAKQLIDFVNTFADKETTEDFITEFCRSHKTLQQSAFRLILKLTEAIASEDYRNDGRNVASHLLAKEIVTTFKDKTGANPSEFLPFI